MSTAPRMVAVLSAAAILAAVTPTADAAPQIVPPEPVSCQNDFEVYTKALAEIHAAQRHATTTEKRTLQVELVELRRDRDLEPSTC
jgi:hypothetical protein